MFPRGFHFLKLAFLLSGTVLPLFGSDFVPPAEGPLPFRRDKLPLETDRMLDLSLQVSNLADGLKGETAKERRGAAQLLGLSLALDPVNTGARELLNRFAEGNHRMVDNLLKVQETRDRIQELLGWLETDAAGADGQALAGCLKDALAISEFADENGGPTEIPKEVGKWAGWIPELARYEEKPTVNASDQPSSTESDGPEKPAIPLASAMVTVPLWRANVKSTPPTWKMVLSELKMTAAESLDDASGKPQLRLVIGDAEKNPRAAAARGPILKMIRKLYDKLPESLSVTLESDDLATTWPKSKSQPFSAAAAVLASAAVTGREPSGTILGEVDEAGNYSLPASYWLQLRSLPSGGAPRVILPAAAASDLPSILAMGDPRFFLDHEILLAKDFQQLLDLSAAEPDATTKAVHNTFKEIREKAGTSSLGPYLASPAVRRRLTELAQAAPYHYSARLLAIQGAGDRPTFIARNVLISELLVALEPMDWLVKRGREPFNVIEVDQLGATFESCRSEVEKLLRFTDKSDRQPVETVLEMVALIRTLDRASRTRPDSSGNNMAQQTAYTAFLKSAKETLGLLDPAAAADTE